MRAIRFLGVWLPVLLLTVGARSASGQGPRRVRPPARAGQFYEGTRSSLAAQVDRLLARAPTKEVSGRLVALIAPHAGYTFSGLPAAAGFKLLRGTTYTRVIVLGVPHTVRLTGCSIPNYTDYETPLGEIPLDVETCAALLRLPAFRQVTRAHRMEHSIEVELPFLQRTLSDFSIVPILVGEMTDADRTKAAEALRGLLDDSTLIVVSSDFTHYGARFGYQPFRSRIKDNLDKLDHGAVEHILKLDPTGFTDYVDRTGATICGRKGIALLLEVLKPLGDVTATELAYTTSGHLTGDWSHCVSYCTIAFTRGQAEESARGSEKAEQPAGRRAEAATTETMVQDGLAPSEAAPPVGGPKPKLTGPELVSSDEQQACLELARQSLEHYFKTGTLLEVDGSKVSANLHQRHGCFVSLKKEGRLRGCIGRIVGDMPLYKTIIEYAVHAALRDPRFQPVTRSELPDLHIEISVMTPLERVTDVNDIQVGRDGLLIKVGYDQGLLLPQVATEWGWNRDTFLAQTCRKAGLPLDAWKGPQAQIYRFSAQVFGEKE